MGLRSFAGHITISLMPLPALPEYTEPAASDLTARSFADDTKGQIQTTLQPPLGRKPGGVFFCGSPTKKRPSIVGKRGASVSPL